MLNKKQVITALQKAYPFLKQEYNVKRLALFGSVARDEITEDSDVDLYVEFDGKSPGIRFFDLNDHLEEVLGTKVDLLTPGGIKSIRIPKVAMKITQELEDVQTN